MLTAESGSGCIKPMRVNFGHSEYERLSIVVSGDELQRVKQSSDTWLAAEAEIKAGKFSGRATLWLDLSDFARFITSAQSLYNTLEGEARFETIESQIGFLLKGDGKGHIALTGFLLDRCGDGNELRFTLDFDQTMLPKTISEIENLLNSAAK
jgi:hypothetical protein